VTDDGIGLGAAANGGRPGVGLKNARSHLAHLYGDDASLRLSTGADGQGVTVDITIPHRHAARLSGRVAEAVTR
jgi:sensor histidine kinase YesM